MTSRTFRLAMLLLVMSAAVAACDSSDANLTTTSSLVTEPGSVGSTTTAPETVSTTASPATTLVGETVTSYEIVARESTDNGDVLHIVIPQGAYTDVDMENFVGDLLEAGVITWGAEVLDDATAADALLKPEADRTAEEVELLDQHHFLSVVGANTIIFRGPFEESGQMVIGS